MSLFLYVIPEQEKSHKDRLYIEYDSEYYDEIFNCRRLILIDPILLADLWNVIIKYEETRTQIFYFTIYQISHCIFYQIIVEEK